MFRLLIYIFIPGLYGDLFFSAVVRWGVGLERKYIVMYLYKTFLWVYLALPAHVELWPLLV